MRTRLIAVGVAAALVLAACGDDGSPTDENGTASESGGEETLADFFGWGTEDPAESEQRWRDQEARIQESIRVCMAEQGFDYRPMVPPDESFVAFDDWDEEEYVKREGFGITTHIGREDEFAGPDFEWTDPNQDILDAMSDSEQEAWYAALYGTPEEQDADMTLVIDEETGEEWYEGYGWGAGCQGDAYEAEYGGQGSTGELWEELNPQFEEMWQRIQADPRMVEANQGWSTCMTEAGFNYTSQEDMWEKIWDDFWQRAEEIVGPNMGWVDPMEGWTEAEMEAFWQEATEEEIDALYNEAQQAPADYDEEALAALQQEEIDLAVANFECSRNMQDLYQEVSREYEAEFIAANRAILEQIREAENR